MNATREAEELVRLWQELQAAQVAGDRGRLASLRVRAEAEARRPDASPEWELLAREAGRHGEYAQEAREAQPSAGFGTGAPAEDYSSQPYASGPGDAGAEWELDEVSTPDSATEPTVPGRSRGRGLGPIIWVVILVGYLILQVIGNLTGDGP